MDVLLTGGVTAVVGPGPGSCPRPELLLDGSLVTVGPYADRDAHEQQVLDTDGSVDWFSLEHVDELRFDRGSGLLRSLALHVPDQPAGPCSGASELPPPTPGTLRLGETRQFHLPATTVRRHTPAALLCHYIDPESSVGTPSLRLRVAEDLDLLFTNGRLTGWLLTGPARHLSDGSGPSPAVQDDNELAAALARFLTLTTYPALDALLDEDPRARLLLERIHADIPLTAGDFLRRAVLRDRIDELIADWYG
ncbi:hypothetical protein [Kitasatospora sp. McL0602]|uniref:hypothetical protein n=1 Tax=Kitasatospora sp. McL0602 TaxID=3439530 RepID=UPI003F8B02C6